MSPASSGPILVLTSSLLTDRILRHGSVLAELAREHPVIVWSTTDLASIPAEEIPEGVDFDAFPENRDYPGRVEMLRGINDLAWVRRSRLPSRTDQWDLGLKANPSMTRQRLSALLDMTGQQQRFERLVGQRMMAAGARSDAARRIGELAPSCVLSMSPHWSRESMICAAAMQRGIPTFAFVTSFDNLSTKRRVELPFDGWMVWSGFQRQELLAYYPAVRPSAVDVVGAPQFDVFDDPSLRWSRAEWCARVGVDPDRPIVLYALGSPNLIDELPGAVEFVQRVEQGVVGDAQVIVRPHPIHDDSRVRDAFAHLRDLVVVQRTNRTTSDVAACRQDRDEIADWVNTFRHADLVVNLSSTVTVDACVAGTPVISLDFDPSPTAGRRQLVKSINRTWPHFASVVETGGVRMVADHDDLVDAARAYLANPLLDASGRRQIAELVCGHVDGRCGERLARAVLERMGACDPAPMATR